MMSQRAFSGLSLFIFGAVACAFAGAGCFRERILVGEDWFDASAGPYDGRSGGATGQGTGGRGATPTSDAGTGGATTDGEVLPTDAGSGSMTVVSLGDKDSQGWPIAITGQEVARRLSQLLLRRPPTAALTAAVVASAPKTNQDVGQLTDGLLLQEDSLAGRQAFYRWWLDLDAWTTASRDPLMFPAFTADVQQALIDQALLFIEDITWRPQGDLSTLLTEPAAYVTAATAPWFSLAGGTAGSIATRVTLDPAMFAGIVTQPAVVAVADSANRISPTRRGIHVLERFFCENVPPPPPQVTVEPDEPVPGTTLRQWLETSVAGIPACASCHREIDPPGFAFGHFNAVGAFQATDGNLPIDTSGTLGATTSHGAFSFAGAPGLATELAQLPAVRTCFATHWLQFASGQFPSAREALQSSSAAPLRLAADADYVVRRATIQNRLNLRGTIRAVTETHVFLDP